MQADSRPQGGICFFVAAARLGRKAQSIEGRGAERLQVRRPARPLRSLFDKSSSEKD